MYGRNEEGCGATIGAMPRCNFSCQGCYLGEEANHIPEVGVQELKEQMLLLRSYLGPWGNLQLTDGEVTLRKEEELIELLLYAKEIELIPMIMTHGDTFRKDPELLYRLVTKGYLREVSFHIDSTQRGRYGEDYRYANSELELIPLREEFANLIRSVKKETGFTLRAASTVTTHRGNVEEVPELVQWYMKNSDAFRIVSFLPMAQVGRTETELGDISHEEVWDKIKQGLSGTTPAGRNYSDKTQWWMGHPDCNRFLFGFVKLNKDSSPTYRRLSIAEDSNDKLFLEEIYRRWPGLTIRASSKLGILTQFFSMLKTSPKLFLIYMPKFLSSIFRELEPNGLLSLAWNLLTGQEKISRFTIVTHNFMNSEELSSEVGQERLASCSFKVPFNGELVSMCEMNATGKRSQFYKMVSDRAKAESNQEQSNRI